jgi:hypothetical protein
MRVRRCLAERFRRWGGRVEGVQGAFGTFLKRYGGFWSAKRDADIKREEIKWLTGREYLMAR